MTSISRLDRSRLGEWWWTVDRWTLSLIMVLVGFGALMTLAASPPVARRLDVEPYYFVTRQWALLAPTVALVFASSMLTPRQVRRLAAIAFLPALAALYATLVIGTEIKGATRWITIAGLSLQPSEFVKPCLVVLSAWVIAEGRQSRGFPGQTMSLLLYLLVVVPLLLQPDLGQSVLVTMVWFLQLFVAGLPWALVFAVVALGVFGLVGAYFAFPHVASRINRFLDPSSGDTYQVDRSMEAFQAGGLFGTGPGEGTVKNHLPDAHADFVFAVAGEELGALACIVVVALFAVILIRAAGRLMQEQSLFVLLAGSGLFGLFAAQALINMASTLRLMPAKGMTLPFVSYGGSSLLTMAVTIGFALCLTRRNGSRGGGLP